MVKYKKKYILSFIALFAVVGVLFAINDSVFAQSLNDELRGQTDAFSGSQGANMENQTSPQVFMARVINIALGFLGTLIVLYILYGGFLIMTSQGSQDKIDKGKTVIKNSTIGAFVVITSFAITTFVFRAGGGATLGGQCVKRVDCTTTLTTNQCSTGSFCDSTIPGCVADACSTNDDCGEGFTCETIQQGGSSGRSWRVNLF